MSQSSPEHRLIPLPDLEDRLHTVDAWIQDHLPEIITGLSDELQEMKKGGPHDPRIDLARRTLSEMPLCRFWNRIALPPTFILIKKGEVLAKKSTGGESRYDKLADHVFVRNRLGEVLCLTIGQFLDKQYPHIQTDDFKPGSRIQYYVNQDANLFRVYEYKGTQITRLYGETKDVLEKLGLWYRKNPNMNELIY